MRQTLMALLGTISLITIPKQFVYDCEALTQMTAAGTTHNTAVHTSNGGLTGQGSRSPSTPVSSYGTVTDIDGNVYQTVIIGTQVWMAENLKVTHYRNGDLISNVTDSSGWSSQTAGAYCNYANEVANVAAYGRLYNWYATSDDRNIAPTGWHVPNDVEWQTLVDYLGGDAVAGWKMKEAGTAHWLPPNTGGTNECGYTALPGGYRGWFGIFADLGNYATFWTSTSISGTHAWYRSISYDNPEVSHYDSKKHYGFSVRCVKDAGCCIGVTGNVNLSGIVDLGDLSALVSYLTGGGYILPCNEAANVNGVGIVDLSDLSALVSYLTGGGYALPNCP